MAVIDIISRAMRLLGVYSIGEAPSADESASGLAALNSMLDSWSTQNLFIYAQSTDPIPLTANVGSYLVGPDIAAAFITPRPVQILDSTYIDLGGVSCGIEVLPLANYNNIALKTDVSGVPSVLYALMTMPNITLNLWPVPSQAMTLNLVSNKVITSFAAIADPVVLPPGYDRALVYSLAEELAPEYQIAISPDLARKAAHARKTIKRINTEVPLMQMPYGIPQGRWYQNYRLG
jgi:hypothetical protein